jgi:hypothetical protein
MTNKNDKNFEIELTPNFDRLFATFTREMGIQAEHLGGQHTLRDVHGLLVAINVAAQSMTTKEAVEQFRETMMLVCEAVDRAAGALETQPKSAADIQEEINNVTAALDAETEDPQEHARLTLRREELIAQLEGAENAASTEALLERVQETQSAFWGALRDLEGETGLDLDSTVDYAGYSVEDLHDAEAN